LARRRLTSFLNSSGLYTGTESSMCPQCPGQCSSDKPQVTHLCESEAGQWSRVHSAAAGGESKNEQKKRGTRKRCPTQKVETRVGSEDALLEFGDGTHGWIVETPRNGVAEAIEGQRIHDSFYAHFLHLLRRVETKGRALHLMSDYQSVEVMRFVHVCPPLRDARKKE